MEGSILIYGANRFSRQQKVMEYANSLLRDDIVDLKTTSPDVLIIEKEGLKNGIGIDRARDLINFLSEYPYQESHKIAIILTAESLTIPAQNALLKILEEPPAYALIILEAKSENSLLETVVSRCQKIAAKALENINDSSENSIEKIKAMDMGNRFIWADETSKMDKQDIVDLLEDWIDSLRTDVVGNKNAIKNTLKVAKDLEHTNINTRLALEYLVLNIEE